MKKMTKLALAALCVTLGAGALVACGDKNKKTDAPPADDGKVTVTFYDGETVLDTVEIDKGDKVTKPTDDPTKSGYDFVRWCGTPTYSVPFDFDSELEEDTAIFAGFRSQAAVDKTYYILGESGSTDRFKLHGWQSCQQDEYEPSEIPASNLFEKSAEQGNLFTLTGDFYVGDKFQIVDTETGWSGQIGFGYLTPSQQSSAEDAQIKSGGGLGDGAKKANIQIGVSGNYTFKLYVDADGKLTEFEYERNGDAEQLDVEYEYYIKGNKITAWQNMLVPYTKFKTEDNEVYTLTIGMKENDEFMFLYTQRGDATNTASSLNTTGVKLAEDADTTAAVADNGNGNFKIAAGEGTYTITITEDGDDRTLSAKKDAATLPQYDFYVKGSMNGDSNWLERYDMTLEGGVYKLQMSIAKDDKFMVTVAEKGDAEKTEIFGIGSAYAYKSKMSNQINLDGNEFMATAADTFTISIDPATMLVTVEGVHDIITWKTGIYGKIKSTGKGDDWVDGPTCDIISNAQSLTGSIEVELAVGDTFGFRTTRNGSQKGWANAAAVQGYTFTGCDGLTGEGNLTCSVAGTYKVDFVIKADGTFVSVTVTKK